MKIFRIQPNTNAPSDALQSKKKKASNCTSISILHAVGSKQKLVIQKRLGCVQDTYLFRNGNFKFKKVDTHTQSTGQYFKHKECC